MPDSVPSVREELGMLKSLPFDELINRFVGGIVTLAINLLIAIVVFYIGKYVIRKIYNILMRILVTRRVDNSIMTFALSFVRIVLYFILIVTVIGILGIETSSFLALFASAGVAIGMALSGTLQNFAGGVLILLLKPYRVGDYIEAQGFAGTVKEIQIFSTIILTPDNKSIIIPNGGLSTGSVNNYSREAYRRVDWSVGISYGDNVDDARKAILEILDADERILQRVPDENNPNESAAPEDEAVHSEPTPEPDNEPKRSFWRLFRRHRKRVEEWKEEREQAFQALNTVPYSSPSVVVNELADSSVNLKVRAWTHTANYWAVYYDMNERFYEQLPNSGVNFPFPQLDVHFDKPTESSASETPNKP